MMRSSHDNDMAIELKFKNDKHDLVKCEFSVTGTTMTCKVATGLKFKNDFSDKHDPVKCEFY